MHLQTYGSASAEQLGPTSEGRQVFEGKAPCSPEVPMEQKGQLYQKLCGQRLGRKSKGCEVYKWWRLDMGPHVEDVVF